MTTVLQAATIEITPQDDVKKALSVVQPGDVVLFKEGDWVDVEIKLHVEATAEQPVVLKVEQPERTSFRGKSHLSISGNHITVDGFGFENPTGREDVIELRTHSKRLANHCRVTNCRVIESQEATTDKKSAAVSRGESRWLSIYGTANRVDHCHLEGKSSAGTTMVVWVGETPGKHRIDHNYFGPRKPLGKNGGETLRIGVSDVSLRDEQTTVEMNLFQACDGEAEIVSNKSCGNLYRHNVFLECAGTLTLRHGHRCRVEGNVFLANKKPETGGIRVIGEDHVVVNNYLFGVMGDEVRSAICVMNGVPNTPLNGYSQVKNAVIAHNTIIDCKYPLTIGYGDRENTLAPEQCRFMNNAIQTSKNLIKEFASPIDWQFAGNVVAGAIRVKELPSGFRRDELGLAPPDSRGFMRIKPSSPLIDRGQSFAGQPEFDIDDASRSSPFDVGCDELGGDGSSVVPERSEVGTAWAGVVAGDGRT